MRPARLANAVRSGRTRAVGPSRGPVSVRRSPAEPGRKPGKLNCTQPGSCMVAKKARVEPGRAAK
eukprot:673155-Hanusia_phi.AAC.1